MDKENEKTTNKTFKIKEITTANNLKENKVTIIFDNFSRLGLIMQKTKGY